MTVWSWFLSWYVYRIGRCRSEKNAELPGNIINTCLHCEICWLFLMHACPQKDQLFFKIAKMSHGMRFTNSPFIPGMRRWWGDDDKLRRYYLVQVLPYHASNVSSPSFMHFSIGNIKRTFFNSLQFIFQHSKPWGNCQFLNT